MGHGDEPTVSGQVQGKPRIVQDALWRIVYDNDYYPQGLKRSMDFTGYSSDGPLANQPPKWQQPWQQPPGENGLGPHPAR